MVRPSISLVLGVLGFRRWKFTGETCPRTHFILAEILVLAGGAILPAPAVPASTMISARLQRAGSHSSSRCEGRLSSAGPLRGADVSVCGTTRGQLGWLTLKKTNKPSLYRISTQKNTFEFTTPKSWARQIRFALLKIQYHFKYLACPGFRSSKFECGCGRIFAWMHGHDQE